MFGSHREVCLFHFFNTDPKYQLAILQPLYYTPYANYHPAYTLTIQRSFYRSQTKWKRILKWQKTCNRTNSQELCAQTINQLQMSVSNGHLKIHPCDILVTCCRWSLLVVFCSALLSTHCALVACDSQWVIVTSYNMFWISTEMA